MLLNKKIGCLFINFIQIKFSLEIKFLFSNLFKNVFQIKFEKKSSELNL